MLLKTLTSCKLGKDLEIEYWEDELELPDLIHKKIDEISKQEFKDYDDLEDYECFNRLIGVQREELDEEFGVGNRYSVDFFQIISPYKQDFFGTTDLNYRLQHKYHSRLWSFIPGVRAAPFGRVDDFTHFDKVIQVKNRYRQWFEWDFKNRQRDIIIDFLANGQLGTTRVWKSPFDNRRYLQLEYRGEEDKLLKADANFAEDNLELAYVLTVHKVQGSQFNVVVVIIPEKRALFSKELIYTAISPHISHPTPQFPIRHKQSVPYPNASEAEFSKESAKPLRYNHQKPDTSQANNQSSQKTDHHYKGEPPAPQFQYHFESS
jgi:hypothetical protein